MEKLLSAIDVSVPVADNSFNRFPAVPSTMPQGVLGARQLNKATGCPRWRQRRLRDAVESCEQHGASLLVRVAFISLTVLSAPRLMLHHEEEQLLQEPRTRFVTPTSRRCSCR